MVTIPSFEDFDGDLPQTEFSHNFLERIREYAQHSTLTSLCWIILMQEERCRSYCLAIVFETDRALKAVEALRFQ